MLFDTHFHLDLAANPSELVREIERQKIYTIAVTNLPELFSNTEKLCINSKYLRPALGYHPELVSKYKSQFDSFVKFIDKTKYIGEIGLDNQRKTQSDYSSQREVFEKIIDRCGAVGGKVLTVHSRKAEEDVVSIIGNNFPGKVILHWYSGSVKELERALSYGFYFSINYNMTKSLNGKKIIQRIPNERILLESDGPFTTIDGKPFSPLMISLVQKEIYNIKTDFPTLKNEDFLFSNFRRCVSS